MPRRIAGLVALLLVVAVAGCGDDGAADSSSPTEPTAAGGEGDEVELDDTPFCVAIRELEALGTEQGSSDGSKEAVLRQNDQVVALVEEASAGAPDDAPAAVERLFEDYRVLSAAVGAAGGDTDAAFAALTADEPELLGRLSSANAHREAFTYFAERCGTAPPP